MSYKHNNAVIMPKQKNDKLDTEVSQKTDNTGKLSAIKIAMEQIEKQYGKGSIMRLGEQSGSKL
jgi:hypothetical protein